MADDKTKTYMIKFVADEKQVQQLFRLQLNTGINWKQV